MIKLYEHMTNEEIVHYCSHNYPNRTLVNNLTKRLTALLTKVEELEQEIENTE